MTMQLTKDTLHETLLRTVIHELDNEADALAWITLLHTHHIQLNAPIVIDAPGYTHFPALTQRDASAVVARLWKHQQHEASQPAYWYRLWNEQHGYETTEDMPSDLKARIAQLSIELTRDDRVLSVEPEG
jgi:hypothetical protein